MTGLLSVADDMERALESVPAGAEQKKDPAALLQGLRDGIALTHRSLEKVPPYGSLKPASSELTCLHGVLAGRGILRACTPKALVMKVSVILGELPM